MQKDLVDGSRSRVFAKEIKTGLGNEDEQCFARLNA
jgi:hypothetical protein